MEDLHDICDELGKVGDGWLFENQTMENDRTEGCYAAGARLGTEQGIMQLFLDHMRNFSVPPRDREKALLQRAQEGDAAAREELANCHLRLVLSEARKRSIWGSSLTINDLLGAGCYGLVRAIDLFNLDKGDRFSTYAVPWIRHFMRKAIQEMSPFRLPKKRRHQIRGVTAHLHQSLKRQPTLEEVSEATGIPLPEIISLQVMEQYPISLDAPIGGEAKDITTFGDLQTDEGIPDPSEIVLEGARNDAIHRALLTLPHREREILRLRYGLDGCAAHTYAEIGQLLGVSPERVRRIESTALKRLRQMPNWDELS